MDNKPSIIFSTRKWDKIWIARLVLWAIQCIPMEWGAHPSKICFVTHDLTPWTFTPNVINLLPIISLAKQPWFIKVCIRTWVKLSTPNFYHHMLKGKKIGMVTNFASHMHELTTNFGCQLYSPYHKLSKMVTSKTMLCICWTIAQLAESVQCILRFSSKFRISNSSLCASYQAWACHASKWETMWQTK